MEYVDWFFRVIIAGFAIWMLRAYLIERTKKRKASDEYLTQAEVEKAIDDSKPNCEKEHKKLKGDMKTEIKHVHELIKKDLEVGSQKFDEYGKDIKAVEGAVMAMSGDLQALCAVLEKNGVKIGR